MQLRNEEAQAKPRRGQAAKLRGYIVISFVTFFLCVCACACVCKEEEGGLFHLMLPACSLFIHLFVLSIKLCISNDM